VTGPSEAAFPEHLRMPETPELATARLLLRPIRERDIGAFRRLFRHWDVVKYLSAGVPWPVPEGDAEAAMADTLAKMAGRERCSWALTLKGAGDDALIGRIDLWADDEVSRDQRGFWLGRDYWGRGFMTEAANRIADYALVELGWPHLWLCNAEINAASHRVKEKQGATIVSRTPNNYVYGPGVRVTWLLTREAWLAWRDRR
jgi:[ribosomal protein S5]-alanine N-acetyltransferase